MPLKNRIIICLLTLVSSVMPASAAMRLSAADDPATGFAIEGYKQTAPGVWQSKGATVRVGMEQSPQHLRVTIKVENGWESALGQINFRLPSAWIGHADGIVTNGRTRYIFSGYRGGTVKDWPTQQIQSDNPNTWPGFCYSPIACFYNTDGAGYALTAINPQIDPMLLYWTAYPGADGRVDVGVRWFCRMQRGQVGQCMMELRQYDHGLPQAHLSYYRDQWLTPIMKKLGIQEAVFHATAPWSMNSSLDWNYQSGTLTLSILRHKAMGSQGYVQWPPSSQGRGYYEPHPPRVPWWEELLTAKKIAPPQGLGVLINPFDSPRLRGVERWYPHWVAPQDINSPDVKAYMQKLRAALKQRGVNICYWDTGGNSKDFSGRDWLELIKTWKSDGIALMPENSSDVAAWTGGSTMIFAGLPNDPIIPSIVTPKAAVFYFDPRHDGWWDRMAKAGLIPLLTENQLKVWAVEHHKQ